MDRFLSPVRRLFAAISDGQLEWSKCDRDYDVCHNASTAESIPFCGEVATDPNPHPNPGPNPDPDPNPSPDPKSNPHPSPTQAATDEARIAASASLAATPGVRKALRAYRTQELHAYF